MTVSSDEEYDPSVHFLSVQDISVDDAKHMLCISIKQSKTDPFRKGVNLFVGKTGSLLCPMSAMLSYLREGWRMVHCLSLRMVGC